MLSTDVKSLDGKVVLVRSARNNRNPETAVRGTIEVREPAGGGEPSVQVALEFPQMFTTRAHHRTIALTPDEVRQLLAPGPDGALEITLVERLDPAAPPGNDGHSRLT
jgi:hypothetical protein